MKFQHLFNYPLINSLSNLTTYLRESHRLILESLFEAYKLEEGVNFREVSRWTRQLKLSQHTVWGRLRDLVQVGQVSQTSRVRREASWHLNQTMALVMHTERGSRVDAPVLSRPFDLLVLEAGLNKKEFSLDTLVDDPRVGNPTQLPKGLTYLTDQGWLEPVDVRYDLSDRYVLTRQGRAVHQYYSNLVDEVQKWASPYPLLFRSSDVPKAWGLLGEKALLYAEVLYLVAEDQVGLKELQFGLTVVRPLLKEWLANLRLWGLVEERKKKKVGLTKQGHSYLRNLTKL